MKLLETAVLRLYAFAGLRALFHAKPTVVSSGDDTVTIKIPGGSRFNKNLFGGLYFGSAMMAAECAAGYLLGKRLLETKKKGVAYVVTHVHGDFSKPARGDTTFTAKFERPAADYVDECVALGERVDLSVEVVAEDPKRQCSKFKFDFSLLPPRGKK